MPTPRGIVRTDMTRIWLQEGGAGPAVAPEYMGVWRAGAISWDQGTSTAIEIPSDSEYGKFQEVDSYQGAAGKPTMPLTARYSDQLSEMLRITRRACLNDLQVHIGKCEDLQDFQGGWRKIVALDKFTVSNYSTGDLGALSSDERAAVDETINAEAQDLYEIVKLTLAEICAASVIQEVLAVAYGDVKSCGGECGDSSNGCQKLFALIKSVGGSPGLGAQIVYSDDAGSSCGSTPITSLAANEEPNDMAVLGLYVVVVSANATGWGHHYALKEDVLDGTETWVKVTVGYVNPGGVPRCIFALKAGYAFIGGAGGYIYSLDSPANSPVVLDAGSATVQALNAIHAFDELHILAVGAANAVVYSTDGSTFAAVTGPAPAVALNACWMKSETEWWVGTAGGELYYTTDSGVTWTLKGFPGSGSGVVRDINFATNQVGYLAHDTALVAGRILRTIDGGYSWYVLPEGTGAIPANDKINSLATCKEPNVVLGGGLADNGTDGALIKGS